jgi:hypothetical protein
MLKEVIAINSRDLIEEVESQIQSLENNFENSWDVTDVENWKNILFKLKEIEDAVN